MKWLVALLVLLSSELIPTTIFAQSNNLFNFCVKRTIRVNGTKMIKRIATVRTTSCKKSERLFFQADSQLLLLNGLKADVETNTQLINLLSTDINSITSLNQGPEGPQGPIGPQGPAGVQGVEGPQGPQGVKGDTGAQGLQGIQGIQGEKGDKGDKGDQGAQGLQGIQGPQGVPGPQGPQGSAGMYDAESGRVVAWTSTPVYSCEAVASLVCAPTEVLLHSTVRAKYIPSGTDVDAFISSSFITDPNNSDIVTGVTYRVKEALNGACSATPAFKVTIEALCVPR